jgi:hypothetical protein
MQCSILVSQDVCPPAIVTYFLSPHHIYMPSPYTLLEFNNPDNKGCTEQEPPSWEA